MLRFRSLGSGSAGNALLVQASDGQHISTALIDCGLGNRRMAERMAQSGVEPGALDAIFVTHEHADHMGSALALAQRDGVPLWMSRGTWAAIGSPDLGPLLQLAADAQPIEVGALLLAPFTVPHDAREPLQLTCSDGAGRLGRADLFRDKSSAE